MCFASIDMTALEEMNESVVEECERCDGSGYVGRGHPNDPCPDLERCERCDGTGEVVVEAEVADAERLFDEVAE